MAVSTPQVFAVEANGAVGVADLGNDLARQLVEVQIGAGGDLTQEHHEAGLGGLLRRPPREWILLQAGVQHRIAQLIADFIRVPFR